MTESTVTYIAPNRTDAGAVPKGTTIATHDRAGDGAEVQDVYIDGAASLPLPAGAATSVKQSDGTAKTQIVDAGGDIAEVVTGANTGVKGLRVYGGPTDPISDIPVFMSYDHHQIHEGEMWHWDTLIMNLASAASYDILFTVPNITIPAGEPTVVRMPHFRFAAVANDLCNIFFYEAPTTTGGTAATPLNYERNGVYTVKLAIATVPSVSAVGTQIDAVYFLSGSTSQSKAENAGESPHEHVLKNNTKYLFRVTSGASGCDIHVSFNWYEDLGV